MGVKVNRCAVHTLLEITKFQPSLAIKSKLGRHLDRAGQDAHPTTATFDLCN